MTTVTWRLIQTDPYAYALLDMLGNPIAEMNFYPELLELFDDTTFGTDADRENNRRIATLAAAAPEMLEVLIEVAKTEGCNGVNLFERYKLDPEGLNPYEKRIVAIIAKAKGETK